MAAKTAKSPASSSAASPAGYTVLARRYRSRNFDEIIGQEPIARTLQNAVATGRAAHAYLFHGTRGVGKTSMARIFAKALNATPDLSQAEEIGNAILRGEDLDVIEIDAASNRGVNEARDLIANAGLMPSRCPYKIYIIDEVHALTKDAFNTLLKTMEEPPPHVKFILCTTDPHKVPATIQSRCQRFDFRPISTQLIADHLADILKKEKISADREVVLAVARHGNGSMRDALSLMDRLLAVGESNLTVELLDQLLGLPEQSAVVALIEAISTGDPAAAISSAADLLSSGATVDQALESLIEHFRILLLAATCGADSPLLDVSEDTRRQLSSQVSRFDSPALVHMIALCDSVARSTRGSSVARAVFDAAIVRLALAEQFVSTDSSATARAAAPLALKPTSAAQNQKKKFDEEVALPASAASKSASNANGTPLPSASTPAPVHTAPSTITEPKPTAQPQPVSAKLSPEELWSALAAAAAKSLRFGSWVEDLIFHGYESETLKLAVAPSGAPRARFMKVELESFTNFARQALGFSIRIDLDISVASAQPTHANVSAEAIEAARKIPLVAFAADLFNASIVDVQDASPISNSPGVQQSSASAADAETSEDAHIETSEPHDNDSLIIDHEEFLTD